MDLKAAIFDMDGTLINSLIAWEFIWKSVGDFCGIENFKPKEEHDRLARTMLYRDAIGMICREYNLNKDPQEVFLVAVKTLESFYATTVECKEGVIEFLEYLKSKNVKMCIATASDMHLLSVAIKHCGLDKYFSIFSSCKDVGKGKDSPQVFIRAAELLGVEISDAWVFEDSCTAIKTAAAAGFKTVAVFDANNYGQAEMQAVASEYIAKGETLMKLVAQGKI